MKRIALLVLTLVLVVGAVPGHAETLDSFPAENWFIGRYRQQGLYFSPLEDTYVRRLEGTMFATTFTFEAGGTVTLYISATELMYPAKRVAVLLPYDGTEDAAAYAAQQISGVLYGLGLFNDVQKRAAYLDDTVGMPPVASLVAGADAVTVTVAQKYTLSLSLSEDGTEIMAVYVPVE